MFLFCLLWVCVCAAEQKSSKTTFRHQNSKARKDKQALEEHALESHRKTA